ncbi:MAG: class I SAM-dependent methyltransferase, partial [Phycisphaerae bacterium]|nr:class I SAM-dependent methyltransferase [Phycisphaerae bacterium]
ETYGVDISEHAIEVARGRLGNSDVRVHDILEAFPFPDAFFDVALVADVLEHVADPARAIRNISRTLRPGGLLYIASPNNNLVRQLVYKIPDHLEHHVSLMHIEEMAAWLRRLGYEIVEQWTSLNVTLKMRFSSAIGPEMSIIARRAE